MKPRSILFIVLNCCFVGAVAQQGMVTCSSERNQDNSVSIFAESQSYGEYTVKVTFNELEGYTPGLGVTNHIALLTVEKGKREIIKLTRNRSASNYSFQYHYQYFAGRALRKTPDSSFIYLLPSVKGNQLRIFNVTTLQERLGQKRPDDYYATGFVYKLGDTICATRAGVVYDCIDTVKEGEKKSETYRRGRDRIAIQHKDGSTGIYSMLAPVKLLVEPGDNVYPGQPLAVFNKESEKYSVLFSTYFLDAVKLMSDNNISTSSPSYIVHMPVHFYAGNDDGSISLQVNKIYTIQHPKEIVTAELSKKERKKLELE